MNGEKKSSYKPLTTNDIRTQARNWNLAGDVGLLAHLEQFSENICEKTHQTQKYFNELLENYEEVHTKVNNITNQFLALQNCQFVENRVYDEETPTEEKPETKVTNEIDQEKLLLKHYKEAVEIGVKLLDTHFQEVQLPLNSDSDEDEDDEENSIGNGAFIWKPKNPYSGKKFPLLIGSAEWWADDNIGLRDYEENVEVEKMSESESEQSTPSMEKKIKEQSIISMDSEKVITDRPSLLKSSSEDLFKLDKNDNFSNEDIDIFGGDTNPPIGTPKNFLPPFEEKIKQKSEINHSVNENEISEEVNNVPQDEVYVKQNKKMDNAFTKELAAKIGTMNAKNDVSKIKIENLPGAEKPKEKIFSDNLFDDDVDDSNDLFSGNVSKPTSKNKTSLFDGENDDDLFSTSNNLFFESGANIIFESDKLPSPKKKKPFDKKDNQDGKRIPQSDKDNLVTDLFADIDDEDTLFDSKPPAKKQTKESSSTNDGFKKTSPRTSIVRAEDKKKAKGLFDDVNDEFKAGLTSKSGLFDGQINDDLDFKTEIAGDSMEKSKKSILFDNNESPSKSLPFRKQENVGDTGGKPSLFEPNPGLPPTAGLIKTEDASHFPPSTQSGEKKPKKQPPSDEIEDIFAESFKDDFMSEKATANSSKNFLFSDEDDKSLFLDKPKQQDSASVSSSRSSLFDDASSVSKSKLASVFEKDKNSKVEDDLFGESNSALFSDDVLTKKEGNDIFSSKSKDRGRTSLFDDCDDMDDLFGLGKTAGDDIFGEKSSFENSKNKTPSLFEPNLGLPPSAGLTKTEDASHFPPPTESGEKKSKKQTASDEVEDIFAESFKNSKTQENVSKYFEEGKKTGKLENSDELFKKTSTKSSKILPKNDSEDDDLFGNTTDSVQVKGLNLNEKLFEDVDETDKATKVTEVKKAIVSEKAALWEDDGDLFGDNSFKPTKTCSEPKMVADDFDDAELFAGGEKRVSNNTSAEKPKPPSSLSLIKNVSLEGTTKAKSVGKLNIPDNLKSKLESLGKPGSAGPIGTVKSQRDNKIDDLEHSFEPSSGLLKCPSKDRVKIPGRRRPQSRRARQEAIRNSGADFSADFDVGTSEPENSKPTRTSSCVNVSQKKESLAVKESPEPLFHSPSPSNPLSPSTDEEDFFNVPGLDTNFEKEDQSMFKGSLFQSTNTTKREENFLFDKAPVLSPVESISSATKSNLEAEDSSADLLFASCQDLPQTGKVNIFQEDDGEDDNDNLFKTVGEVSKEKERKQNDSFSSFERSSIKFKTSGSEEIRKKPLFDNIGDDEDDLFGGKFTKISDKNEKGDKKSDEHPPAKSKTNPSFVDPLGLMSNDE